MREKEVITKIGREGGMEGITRVALLSIDG